MHESVGKRVHFGFYAFPNISGYGHESQNEFPMTMIQDMTYDWSRLVAYNVCASARSSLQFVFQHFSIFGNVINTICTSNFIAYCIVSSRLVRHI